MFLNITQIVERLEKLPPDAVVADGFTSLVLDGPSLDGPDLRSGSLEVRCVTEQHMEEIEAQAHNLAHGSHSPPRQNPSKKASMKRILRNQRVLTACEGGWALKPAEVDGWLLAGDRFVTDDEVRVLSEATGGDFDTWWAQNGDHAEVRRDTAEGIWNAALCR